MADDSTGAGSMLLGMSTSPNSLVATIHRAARFEDFITGIRERISRSQGLVPTVIPFRGIGTTSRVRILARVLFVDRDPATKKQRKIVRGWRSFTSVPVRHCDVTIRIEGSEFTVTSDRGGVIDTDIELNLSPGWHTFEIRVSSESEWIACEVTIVDPETTVGIISDIDDTVMVTALPRIFLAAWNTFVLDEHARRPVPGMAVFYNTIRQTYPDAPVVYLSTGPWNIAPTLERFLSRQMYPKGPFLLTDWGPTTDRAFRSGREHKVSSLDRLVTDFPNIQWLLMGDDGQHDEKLYGDFARKYPSHVRGVAIRQLSTPEAVLSGAHPKHPEGVPGITWVRGHNGAELAEKFVAEGILPGHPLV